MTSRYSASVRLEAGPAARALFEALSADGGPDGTSSMRAGLDGTCLTMEVDADRLQHLRAALNSHLRLAHAGLESTAVGGSGPP